jgi:tetratricopeptide (TPR) repeat protein
MVKNAKKQLRKIRRIIFVLTPNLFTIFALPVVIIIAVLLFDHFVKISHQLRSLEEQLISISSTGQYTESELLAYYQDLNEQADVGIDRIITFSAAAIATVVAFGVYLAFRAPKEIEQKMEEIDWKINRINEQTYETNKNTNNIDNKISDMDHSIIDINNKVKEVKNDAENTRVLFNMLLATYEDFGFEVTLNEKIQKLTDLTKLYPNNATLFMNIGNYFSAATSQSPLEKKEKYMLEAVSYIKQAMKMQSDIDEYKFHYNMGIAYGEVESYYTNAEEEYNESIKCSPNFAFAYSNLGDLYRKMKYFDKAEKNLLKAKHLADDFDSNYVYLGDLYFDWANSLSDNERKEKLTSCVENYKMAKDLMPYNDKLIEKYNNTVNELEKCK